MDSKHLFPMWLQQNYATKNKLPLLKNVTMIGLESVPSVVILGEKLVDFTFTEGRTFKLMIDNLNINLDKEFHLTWM